MTMVWKNDQYVSKEAMEQIDKHWNKESKAIGEICKECGGPLKHQEGGVYCQLCGASN